MVNQEAVDNQEDNHNTKTLWGTKAKAIWNTKTLQQEEKILNEIR